MHKEMDEKNEIIRRSLALLLNHLIDIKTKRELSPFKIFYEVTHSIDDLTEGIKQLEAIQFQSIADFNSVIKLREIEFFFSKSKTLKDFTYSNYRTQVSDSFLTYVDIEFQLDHLFYKVDDLVNRGFFLAAKSANTLVSDLKKLDLLYFEEKKITYLDYQFQALAAIDKARFLLEEHRGYKELLGNLVVLILTLGTAFLSIKW